MSNSQPLQEGQQVFLKRPVQIYAKVIGPRANDWGLPQEQVYYAVQLMPLEQYYLPEDLELANQSLYMTPENATDNARFNEVVLNLSTGDSLSVLTQEIHDRIARRAYERYECRGCAEGRDAEDWFHAVSEVLLHVPAEITETQSQLALRADVPGVSATDLEVWVAPRSVCITGTRQALPRQDQERAVYSERRSGRIFRALELPCEIDPTNVVASVCDGILEVKLLKTVSRAAEAEQAQTASA
jgi:HSP20 family molecular chaperone IbpA